MEKTVTEARKNELAAIGMKENADDIFKQEQEKMYAAIEKTRRELIDTNLYQIWIETKNHTLRQQIERLATSIIKFRTKK